MNNTTVFFEFMDRIGVSWYIAGAVVAVCMSAVFIFRIDAAYF